MALPPDNLHLLDMKGILKKFDLREKMRVADLGCGASGRFVFACSPLVGSKGKVYAVDVLKEVVAAIRGRIKSEKIANIKVIWSNLEVFNATKIESSSLDLALLINTLFQSSQRSSIVREAIRLIKKGGRLIVIEWDKHALPFGPSLEKRVDSPALKQGAERLGLELIEEFRAGPYHYGMVFIKN